MDLGLVKAELPSPSAPHRETAVKGRALNTLTRTVRQQLIAGKCMKNKKKGYLANQQHRSHQPARKQAAARIKRGEQH